MVYKQCTYKNKLEVRKKKSPVIYKLLFIYYVYILKYQYTYVYVKFIYPTKSMKPRATFYSEDILKI